jgi:hypothetical protein
MFSNYIDSALSAAAAPLADAANANPVLAFAAVVALCAWVAVVLVRNLF